MQSTRASLKALAGLTCAAVMLVAAIPGIEAGAKNSDSKVKVTASAAKPSASGKQVVNVTLVIDKGWHIYANPVGNSDLAETRTVVTVNGKTAKAVYPPGTVIRDKDIGSYRVYENKVSIPVTVERAKGDTSPLELSVRFNACNDKGCLPPATVKLTVK